MRIHQEVAFAIFPPFPWKPDVATEEPDSRLHPQLPQPSSILSILKYGSSSGQLSSPKCSSSSCCTVFLYLLLLASLPKPPASWKTSHVVTRLPSSSSVHIRVTGAILCCLVVPTECSLPESTAFLEAGEEPLCFLPYWSPQGKGWLGILLASDHLSLATTLHPEGKYLLPWESWHLRPPSFSPSLPPPPCPTQAKRVILPKYRSQIMSLPQTT